MFYHLLLIAILVRLADRLDGGYAWQLRQIRENFDIVKVPEPDPHAVGDSLAAIGGAIANLERAYYTKPADYEHSRSILKFIAEEIGSIFKAFDTGELSAGLRIGARL